jgi:hypothetical protein
MEYAVKQIQNWFDDYERRKKGVNAPQKPNGGGRQTDHNDEVCGAVPECNVRNEPLAKGKGEKVDGRRFRVSIIAKRNRLLDPDNACAKAVVDCLRYAGIIKQDDPGSIEYSISQKKVAKGLEETIITVERIA